MCWKAAAVIAIAIDIAERNPQEFAFFDVRAAREAIAYEQALAPVAAQAKQTASRIENSITKRRKTPVDQTLALYAAIKGFVRVPQGEPLIPQYEDMRRLVTTNRKKRKPKAEGQPVATTSSSNGAVAPSAPPRDAATSNGVNGAAAGDAIPSGHA